ncbi:LPXTG cell wall anchor domain-containing protein [Aeromicrobium piscarium]|uniref:LPXTG cell wall anchor domain-containing protein n=2 Tax=Aeromicrobium piscarium TaxID=2590901 RepID=A0A554S7I1_9ACTN|nr:LPXTG cell wall anchor domain-containing protein [Aeromicrobium piscarium]
MNSSPQLDLGTQVADENGDVRFEWQIPASADLAVHSFSLAADDYPDQSIDFRVVAESGGSADGGSTDGGGSSASGGKLPRTGADAGALPLGAIAAMFLMAGAGALVVSRRRDGVNE